MNTRTLAGLSIAICLTMSSIGCGPSTSTTEMPVVPTGQPEEGVVETADKP